MSIRLMSVRLMSFCPRWFAYYDCSPTSVKGWLGEQTLGKMAVGELTIRQSVVGKPSVIWKVIWRIYMVPAIINYWWKNILLLAVLWQDRLTLFWVGLGPARCCFHPFGLYATLRCFGLASDQPDALTSPGWVPPCTVLGWPAASQTLLSLRVEYPHLLFWVAACGHPNTGVVSHLTGN